MCKYLQQKFHITFKASEIQKSSLQIPEAPFPFVEWLTDYCIDSNLVENKAQIPTHPSSE